MDPIADFFTRIRNANMKLKERVDIPFSKIKLELARILKDEGYIANFKPVHNDDKRGMVRIFLKYNTEKEPVLGGIKRISRPGRRFYCSYKEIPKVRGPFGISILSTPSGVMTGSEARKKKVGGEVLGQVW